MITGESGRLPGTYEVCTDVAFVEWFTFKIYNKKYIDSQFYASVKAKVNFM